MVCFGSLFHYSVVLVAFIAAAYASALAPAQVHDGLQAPLKHRDYEDTYYRYAALGDSWASGINYGPPNQTLEYDFEVFEEVCRCRRINEAWPVQLRDEPVRVWTGGLIPDLDFQACHGSWFHDIPDQVARLNKTHAPKLAAMMIGGNPAGFPDIMESCVYQFNRSKEYGAHYPNKTGDCYKALQRSNKKIRDPWFLDGITDAIHAVLNESRIRNDPDFRLYILGYANLFNDQDKACDNQTFGIWSGKTEYLTRALRKEINRITGAGRNLYDRYINHQLRDPRVKFLDIDPAFKGHRFCEPTKEGTQAAQIEKSWLWSLLWPSCIPLAFTDSEMEAPHQLLDVSQDDVHAEAWPSFCRKCGGWVDLGELQRPFHPKWEGHNAIKELLMDQIVQDNKHRRRRSNKILPHT